MKHRFTIIALVGLALLVIATDALAGTNFLAMDPVAFLAAPAAAATLPDQIMNELGRIRSEAVDRVDGLQATLQQAEQKIAQLEQGGGFPSSRFNFGPSPSQAAVEAFGSESAFASAADAARRQQKPGKFDARVNVDSSIRAALVGSGSGSSAVDYPVAPHRTHEALLPGMRSLRLLEVLPHRTTTSDSFEFVQLNATGEASEQDAQGDQKAELDFDGELQRGDIATIAGWTAASKQILGDVQSLQTKIDIVIRHKVLSRLEDQIINGSGEPGKINGLMNGGTVLIPAIGTTAADIIGEAMVRQANRGYLPDLVLMNPLDWYRIQIAKSATEEEYIFGSPTMPVPPALWNTRVVTTPSVPEFSAMTIDSRFTTVLDREQFSIAISNSHSDFFTRNLVAILGELRAGLEIADAFAVYRFTLPGAPVSSEPVSSE